MIRHTFVVCAAVAVGACKFDPPGGGGDGPPKVDSDPTEPDARIDAMPGDPCLDWSYDPSGFDPCGIPQPTDLGPIDLPDGDWTLDGGTGVLSNGAGTDIPLPHVNVDGTGVVSVDHLVIPTGATLHGVGSLPLVIVVWNAATIDGTLDVSSTFAGGASAGANPPACPSGIDGPQRGLSIVAGDGGGGGGGFGAAGGPGGDGGAGLGLGGLGGTGRALPGDLQGGCAGAPGALGVDGTPGRAGDGGGAIHVAVRTTLTITGVVHAGGAGGGGGAAGRAGGGGGGSGGMIILEAADLVATSAAILAANGGQGGGGCDGGVASPGEDGQPDAVEASVMNHVEGGGDGGPGGFLDTPIGGDGEDVGKGGGGGGGAVGYIAYRGHASTDVTDATMSPTGVPF